MEFIAIEAFKATKNVRRQRGASVFTGDLVGEYEVLLDPATVTTLRQFRVSLNAELPEVAVDGLFVVTLVDGRTINTNSIGLDIIIAVRKAA